MWKAVELGTGYYYLDLNHSLVLTSVILFSWPKLTFRSSNI